MLHNATVSPRRCSSDRMQGPCLRTNEEESDRRSCVEEGGKRMIAGGKGEEKQEQKQKVSRCDRGSSCPIRKI